ncbi:ABC transporter ATP-binding protein [Streptomyces sp. DH41]|uniref:ABC transporter ATP-binding protein n=1 Tax=Streptomyces sp. DH41 TaxID=3040125 RepID=UPI00244177B8|nr:ABC transporter ATP-binding protein [Streptomyces sp. DH41]
MSGDRTLDARTPLESRAGTGTARTGTTDPGTTDPGTAVEPLLCVRDLTVTLPRGGRDVRLVDGVGLEVRPGEVVGIAGESGSGKTVTGMTLVGLGPDRATVTGSVRFDGRELVALPDKEWGQVRGRDIAVVFQDPSAALHPMLTVGRQLTDHVRRHQGISRKHAAARAAELLDMVRIPGGASAAARYPHQFSGGMRQRIAIASALACGPRLLIADEPTTALDVTVQAGIVELLDELRRETGMAVVMVTHDLGVLSSIADRIAVFYSGRVIETGTVEEVIGAPQHPYTRGLLQALPHASLGERATVGHAVPLRPIPGSAPAADAPVPGCPFHPRCSSAVDGCDRTRPAPVTIGPARTVACVLAEPGAARPADTPPTPGHLSAADAPARRKA